MVVIWPSSAFDRVDYFHGRRPIFIKDRFDLRKHCSDTIRSLSGDEDDGIDNMITPLTFQGS